MLADSKADDPVIYRCFPDDAPQVMLLLQREGLSPTQIDHPGTLMRYVSLWTVKVRLTVPAGQEDRAREIIQEMTMRQSRAVEQIDREIRRHFLIGGALFGLTLLVLFLIYREMTYGLTLLAGAVAVGAIVLWSRFSSWKRHRND
jgi:hypothetical protein